MKAVIPTAGLGTRFLPITKSQPKEMLPVVDKPVIQYVVKEAVSARIDDILIITGVGKRSIENHFDKSFETKHKLNKNLDNKYLVELEKLSDEAGVHYIRQSEQKGLKFIYKPLPLDDPTKRQPDISRARKLLGWEPRVDLIEGGDNLKIWIDIKNTCEPLLFKTIIDSLNNTHDFFISARDFAGTCELLNEIEVSYKKIGKHYGSQIILKIGGTFKRIYKLLNEVPIFDISISSENLFCGIVSKMRGVPSISFMQSSDIDNIQHKIYDRLLTYVIKPRVVDDKILIKNGVKENNIYSFKGYKELIPIADFSPAPNFKNKIPFEQYIALRPPPLSSLEVGHKVRKTKENMIRRLSKRLSKENFNILYLTRYPYDKEFVKGIENVHILEKPLNGLDIAWYSQGVITGSGTFAREAAGMDIPAVTTYNYEVHKNFLPVDRKLIEDGKMLNSRDVDEIVDHLLNSEKQKPNLDQAKKTKEEVLKILRELIDEIEKKGDF